MWRAPLSRRYARCIDDGAYIAADRADPPATVVVPLEKIQSMRWSQGPWSRRLRLASVFVDTAGQRFTGTARYRDVAQAQQLVDTLPDLARAARQRIAVR